MARRQVPLRSVIAVALAFPAALPAQTPGQQPRSPEAESVAVRAVQARSSADVYLLEEARQVEPDLWVAVVARVPVGRLAPTLHACTVAGRWPELTPACVLLPTPLVAQSDEPFATDSFSVGDMDGDGEHELRITVNYQGAYVRPGVGSDFDRLFVVDLVRRPRVVFAMEIRRYTETTGRTIKRPVVFRDVDNDGHEDALVEESICTDADSGETCTPPRRSTWLWNERTDSWVLYRGR
jgi:hypothetical protein